MYPKNSVFLRYDACGLVTLLTSTCIYQYYFQKVAPCAKNEYTNMLASDVAPQPGSQAHTRTAAGGRYHQGWHYSGRVAWGVDACSPWPVLIVSMSPSTALEREHHGCGQGKSRPSIMTSIWSRGLK
jgi:hypothetical protein